MINHISGADTKVVEQPEVLGRGEETKEENKMEDTGNVNKGYAVTEKPWRMRKLHFATSLSNIVCPSRFQTLVRLTLINDAPPSSCPLVQPVLRISHQPKQK